MANSAYIGKAGQSGASHVFLLLYLLPKHKTNCL